MSSSTGLPQPEASPGVTVDQPNPPVQDSGRPENTAAPRPTQLQQTVDCGPYRESRETAGEEAPCRAAQIAGYEVLKELGRGGMGVVYLARQTRLNRQVALKMILAGGHRGEVDRARFRTEAEVVARLQHPGIVQIYEVGERDGLPFFSLEFCSGGSLAEKLGGRPLPIREAVGLVEELARAVQVAHQAGIIHRDLKPANVLLTADGQPKITDFGLAKKMEGGEGLTQSGAILGTPSYMAPEQARGQGGQVTTLADVYALGAILYECLTGRPPFRATTLMDTILQVMGQEPERPSVLRPEIDRDLELICLKCLAKDPTMRYATADALAVDLQRWRAGEPVSVRAPGLTDILRLWLRQNFGAAGWTLVIGLGCGLLTSAATWLAMIRPVLVRFGEAYRMLPGVERPWLVPSGPAPVWLTGSVGLLSIVPLGLMGLLTAWLVRPRHRPADVAAGLVTGLVAGVTLFTFCFSWLAVIMASSESFRDVGWLTQAAWTEGDAVDGKRREGRPQDRLLEKYPDLENVPPADRGRIVWLKVAGDCLAGIPVGLWFSMVLAVSLAVAIGITGSVVAGPLLRQPGPRWWAIPACLEVTGPTALLCIVGTIVVCNAVAPKSMPIAQPTWYLLCLSALTALAATAPLRGWPWFVRMILQPAYIALLCCAPLFELYR